MYIMEPSSYNFSHWLLKYQAMFDHALLIRVVCVSGFDFHLFTNSLEILLFVVHLTLDVSNDLGIHLNS